jgi:branched-chain amino acid transport system ATP-binding protein
MLLQIADVSRSFNGVTALAGVSIDVCEGECVGIIGPNGSGKTTLFDVISGFVIPDSGTVYFEKRKLVQVPPHKIPSRGIARTFQITELCSSLTILENIGVGAYGSRKNRAKHGLSSLLRNWRDTVKAEALLDIAGFLDITKQLHAFPETLTNFERRKAEIARALVSGPKLLLLDEPTSGFTQAERDSFTDTVHRIKSLGVSLLIIEHDLTLIRGTCSRVIVLDAGQKVADGTPDTISRDGTVSEIYVGVRNVERQ